MNQTVKQIKAAYFSVLALTWFSVALPLPIAILYMQSRGLDLLQVGIVMGIYSLVIVLLELPTGGLADAIGRKKTAVLAQIINLASALGMIVSFSFEGFLLVMILMGIARALSSGALDAWFVDSLEAADPEIDIQPPLAQAGTVTLIALGLGTLLGGFLPGLFSGLGSEKSGLITPFSTTLILAALIKIITIIVTLAAVKEQRTEDQQKMKGYHGFSQVPQIINEAVRLTSNSPVLLQLMGAALVGGFILTAVETFWQPHFANILNDAINNSWMFGTIMAISFLAGVGGNLASVPMSRYLGKRYAWVAFLARAGQGAAFLLLATQSSILPAAAGFWLFYLNLGVINSPHETLVNSEIPAARRSTMLSVQSLVSYIGGFLGGILIGWISNTYSLTLAWIVAGGISMLSLIFYLRVATLLKMREHSNEEKS